MIRLLIVDDQPAVRRGLRMRLALEPDITAVGEAGDGSTALALAARLQPDVVIMDIEMPEMDGISAAAALQGLAPRTAVVILTLHEDADTRRRALAAGAVAVVSKRQCSEDLCGIIRQVAPPPKLYEEKLYG